MSQCSGVIAVSQWYISTAPEMSEHSSDFLTVFDDSTSHMPPSDALPTAPKADAIQTVLKRSSFPDLV